ncbi:hypothetical protein Nepgr_017310 [Nepenthes gracilis]|uniref:Cyclic nucleotide-binding domain-containing protein n=1 Tax=Nepenthes gracilis TaxID=150966 RepID=A0AAD3SR85_NEPGR|nr:hypothetical protein Nepgr_017310 [Nepenthes gracilis]
MDGQLLDAICDRRVSPLSTQGTYIVCEGDFVTEMLFIFRGWLQSTTTNGGRTGFFNSITLRPGTFAFSQGDEWANPFWKLVHDGLNTPEKKHVLAANGMQMCRLHCPVQLLVGYTRKVQFSLGQLAVFNVPAEVTTRNGRRHREEESQTVGPSEADSGGSWKPDVSVVHNENLKLVHSELRGNVVCEDADIVDATADIDSAALPFKQEQNCRAGPQAMATFLAAPSDRDQPSSLSLGPVTVPSALSVSFAPSSRPNPSSSHSFLPFNPSSESFPPLQGDDRVQNRWVYDEKISRCCKTLPLYLIIVLLAVSPHSMWSAVVQKEALDISMPLSADAVLPNKIKLDSGKIPGLTLNQMEVDVAYHWKPVRCSSCKQSGHSKSQCNAQKVFKPPENIFPSMFPSRQSYALKASHKPLVEPDIAPNKDKWTHDYVSPFAVPTRPVTSSNSFVILLEADPDANQTQQITSGQDVYILVGVEAYDLRHENQRIQLPDFQSAQTVAGLQKCCFFQQGGIGVEQHQAAGHNTVSYADIMKRGIKSNEADEPGTCAAPMSFRPISDADCLDALGRSSCLEEAVGSPALGTAPNPLENFMEAKQLNSAYIDAVDDQEDFQDPTLNAL